jgi:hypothetical protein
MAKRGFTKEKTLTQEDYHGMCQLKPIISAMLNVLRG